MTVNLDVGFYLVSLQYRNGVPYTSQLLRCHSPKTTADITKNIRPLKNEGHGDSFPLLGGERSLNFYGFVNIM